MAKRHENPRGGLSERGRRELPGDLKAGVTKNERDMTPSEMQRKGSFLARHYGGDSKPLKDSSGKPTRHALQARAWGEIVPTTQEQARALAEKGRRLLAKYKRNKEMNDRIRSRR